ILALFFLPPTALIEGHGLSLTAASVEVWPIDMLWGYYFSALAVAALVAALIVYERDRRSGRPSAWPPLLGFLATWLQPWEGPLLIGVIVGAEAYLALSRRRAAPAAERAEPAPDLRGLARLALPTVAV